MRGGDRSVNREGGGGVKLSAHYDSLGTKNISTNAQNLEGKQIMVTKRMQ